MDREDARPDEMVDTVLPRPCPCPNTPEHDAYFAGMEHHAAPTDDNPTLRWRIYTCVFGVTTEFEIPWEGRKVNDVAT